MEQRLRWEQIYALTCAAAAIAATAMHCVQVPRDQKASLDSAGNEWTPKGGVSTSVPTTRPLVAVAGMHATDTACCMHGKGGATSKAGQGILTAALPGQALCGEAGMGRRDKPVPLPSLDPPPHTLPRRVACCVPIVPAVHTL